MTASALLKVTRSVDPIRFETCTIDVQLAREWLDRSQVKGRLDRRLIAAYQRDMAHKRWKLNGEPIIFSDKGTLLAGRHRLHACIAAASCFRSLVVHGVPTEAFETIDALRRRTVGDILTIRQLPSGRALAGALALVWRSHNADLADRRKRPPVQEMMQLLSAYPELQDASDPQGSIAVAKDVMSVIPHAMGIAFHFLFSRVDKQQANAFFQQVIDAEHGEMNTPGSVLRVSLQRMKEEGGRRHKSLLMAFIIKAWNAFYNNEDLLFLRYVAERERFPVIAGLAVSEQIEEDVATFGAGSEQGGFRDPGVDTRELQVEYSQITPERAAEILANHPLNRNPAEPVIDRYARDMRAGNWQLNGQTIKVATTGRLLDGQHRLKACIKAGRSFPALVVRDVDEGAFDTFDLGAKKGYHIVLAERGEIQTTALAAALKWLWVYERDRLHIKTDQPTPSELDSVLERHPDIRKSMIYINKLRPLMAPALSVVLHYLCACKGREQANEFFDRLSDGLGMTREDDPIHVLRQKLIKQRASRRVVASEIERMVWLVKAWNAWRRNDPAKQLTWRNRGPGKEPFPEII